MKGAWQRRMLCQSHLSVRKNACCFTASDPSWPKRVSLRTHTKDSRAVRGSMGMASPLFISFSLPPLPSPPLTPLLIALK